MINYLIYSNKIWNKLNKNYQILIYKNNNNSNCKINKIYKMSYKKSLFIIYLDNVKSINIKNLLIIKIYCLIEKKTILIIKEYLFYIQMQSSTKK